MNRFSSAHWKPITLLWITLILSPFSFSTPFKTENHDFLQPLSDLLDLFNIEHKNTLSSMTQAAQVWRRKPDQERWEVAEVQLNDHDRNVAFNLLHKINLVKEIPPQKTEFEHALLLGATVPRMERRLNHLIRLWKKGVRFRNIIFLVGQRPITDNIDDIDGLMVKVFGHPLSGKQAKDARPLTEAEAAKLVYEYTAMPEEMSKVKVTFIDTPRVWRKDHWQRSNTLDTLKYWMMTKPKAGPTLAISDQPHALYQLEVVKKALPDTFQPEVAAQKADSDARLILFLDALALWLHNLQSSAQR